MLSFKTLVDFINRNDYNSLKSFLENRHCNVDDTDEEKNLTALMVAAAQGKLDFVYLLLVNKNNPFLKKKEIVENPNLKFVHK